MNYWNQTPLFRLVFPFVIGILTAIYTQAYNSLILYVTGGIFLFFILVSSINKIYTEYRFRALFGVLINILLFLIGYLVTGINTEKFKSHYFANKDGATIFLCSINEPLQEKEKTYKAQVLVYAVRAGASWSKTTGKAIVYFEKNSLAERLKYGDCVQIHAPFKEIKPPQNPHEFDYKKYLSYNGIYIQSNVLKTQWKILSEKKGNEIKKYACSLREKMLAVFKKRLPAKDEYAVAAALVIGSMDEVDRDLLTSYSAAGVIHVLSVSGLHIGLVYLVLNSLLFFMERRKIFLCIKVVLLIALLWFYALITGFSPSVLRAVMMLTLLIIGQALGRYTNTYNTLAASAFLLLLYQPYLIMNIGFQLSYLAVLGIVFLHPKIYSLWDIDTYIPDKIWQLVSVSIAAQLFTFPLILFCFHQLPTYFIVANLIVIPLATAIMYGGIALILFSKISGLSACIGYCMSFLLKCINYSVCFIESLPYSLWKGITISPWETCLIYVIVAFVILFFLHKKIVFLQCGLCLLLIVFVQQFYLSMDASRQKKVFIYSVADNFAIDFIDGRENVLLADSAIVKNPGTLSFHIHPNWCNLQVKKTTCIGIQQNTTYRNKHLFVKDNFIQFYDKSIASINNAVQTNFNSVPLNVDYLILSKTLHGSISEVLKIYKAGVIIFDGSLKNNVLLKREKECAALKIKYYSIAKSGSFQITL